MTGFALCKLDILKRVQLKLWSISMIFNKKDAEECLEIVCRINIFSVIFYIRIKKQTHPLYNLYWY